MPILEFVEWSWKLGTDADGWRWQWNRGVKWVQNL